MRLKHGYSLNDVAILMGVTKAYIYQIENGQGRLPHFRFMFRLLEVYKIKPKYFEELIDNVSDNSHTAKVVRKNTQKNSTRESQVQLTKLLDSESRKIEEIDEDVELYKELERSILTAKTEKEMEVEVEERKNEWINVSASHISPLDITINDYDLRKNIIKIFPKNSLFFINKLISDYLEHQVIQNKLENSRYLLNNPTKRKPSYNSPLFLGVYKENTIYEMKKYFWVRKGKKSQYIYRAFIYYLSKILRVKSTPNLRKKSTTDVPEPRTRWEYVYKILKCIIKQSAYTPRLRVFEDFENFLLKADNLIENPEKHYSKPDTFAELREKNNDFVKAFDEKLKGDFNSLNFLDFLKNNHPIR